MDAELLNTIRSDSLLSVVKYE